jgi:hypothetical protein
MASAQTAGKALRRTERRRPGSGQGNFAGKKALLMPRNGDGGSTMQRRRRFKKISSLEERLAEEAARLKAKAEALPPGPEKEALLKRARQAETGAHMSEWLQSPGLQPPN